MEDFKRFHLRLLVNNFKACFEFYRDTLELPVRYGDEHADYAEFKTDAIHIALFKKHLMAEVTGKAGKPVDADIQDNYTVILRVDDVDQVYDELVSKGATFETEPEDRTDWGCRTAHLRDPDGNLLELNSDLK
ncbi:MAG: VOC family protein [Desulfobacterales bacterium]|nr:VOC family protein [Desulfobacterales bacterium]